MAETHPKSNQEGTTTQPPTPTPTEAGGEFATAVPPSSTVSADPTGDSTAAEPAGGGESVAGAGVAGENSGGDTAVEPVKVDGGSNNETAAPALNVPMKDPLGPGPFGLDDFDTGVTLGTGSFGRVRIATHKTTQTPWAIKILKKAEIVRMQQVLNVKSDMVFAVLEHSCGDAHVFYVCFFRHQRTTVIQTTGFTEIIPTKLARDRIHPR